MILTLQCGVKYTCHFLSKNPDDPGYIMFLFDNVDCNFRIISLLHGLPRRKEKKSYKAIICLFYIPEAPLAGFSTLSSLYCFIQGFTKNTGSHKNSYHVLTICYLPAPVLGAGSMPSHVTHAKNIGSWHLCPLFIDEEIEARRSRVTFFSGTLSSSPPRVTKQALW